MTPVEDESDDVVWRAQVLLEHQRQRKHHSIINFMTFCLILVMMIMPLLLMALFEIDIFDEIGREGVIFCFLPLLLPLIVGGIFVWRCPACDTFLGRGDPQFCRHCGVQLRFLDE